MAELAKRLLDRLDQVVGDEERQHRRLAEVVGELFVVAGDAAGTECFARYVEIMQSFDRMRQRVDFLAAALRMLEPNLADTQAIRELAARAPIEEDGTWLLSAIDRPGDAA